MSDWISGLEKAMGNVWDQVPRPDASPVKPSGPPPQVQQGPQAQPPAPKNADEAVKLAQQQLENGPETKPEDAVAALHTLTSLSPAQQTQAMAKLDPSTFKTLMEEVPPDKRVEFEQLFKNTHDPKRKLELYAGFETAKADADAAEASTKAGTSEERYKATNLENAARDNHHEMAVEKAKLLEKKDLTEDEVNELITRKEYERKMEVKYGIEISANLDDKDADKRRDWSMTDLAKLDKSLSELPGNGKDAYEVHQFRRGADEGVAKGGAVTLTDAALSGAGAPQLATQVATARVQNKLEAPDITKEEQREAEELLKGISKDQRKVLLGKLNADELTKLAGHVSPEEQAAAVAALDDKQFAEYVKRTGECDSKDQLAVIAALRNDPKRKLELWTATHNVEVEKDLDTDMAKHGTDSPEDKDFAARRKATNAATHEEVQEESDYLTKKMAGMRPEEADKEIDRLIGRKEKEHGIERKYNVNLTNDKSTDEETFTRKDGTTFKRNKGVRGNGDKVVWTEDELEHVDAALEQMPAGLMHDGQLAMNDKMVTNEFHRGIDNYKRDQHGDIVRDKDGHSVDPASLPKDAHGEVMKNAQGDFVDASGNVVTGRRAGGDNAENFMNGKINVYDNSTTKDDEQREKADPDFVRRHGNKVSFQERVLTHEMGHSAQITNPDALQAYKDLGGTQEYFAQDVKSAIKTPETMYRESFEQPHKDLAKHEAELLKLTDPTKKAEKQKEIDEDKFKIRTYPQMVDIMRNKVMHTGEAQDAAEARLKGTLSPTELKEFQERAKMCMTPEQLNRLAEQFANHDPEAMKAPKPDPAYEAPPAP